MFYDSNFEAMGMFSMCSHQRVKQKKKSDRKAGKERRKAEKTLLQSHIDLRLLFVQQLFDLSSGALLEMPTSEKPLVEKPKVEKVEEKVEEKVNEIIDEQTAYFEHYAQMEYELDMLDLLEAQETEFQIRLLKMEKIWAEEEDAGVQDDYIPEIDDDYDF
jgi:hypothetical protein